MAVIDGNRLLFSVEMEKLANNRRYSPLDSLESISSILHSEGIAIQDVDRFAMDGWYPDPGTTTPSAPVAHQGTTLHLPLGPYTDQGAGFPPLYRYTFSGPPGSPIATSYSSYSHVSNHVLGGYCTSPFARRGESALVLVWDGGITPRLYRVNAQPLGVKFLGILFPVIGYVFVQFCASLEPFRSSPRSELDQVQHELEVPGKAMAYAALGKADADATATLEQIINGLGSASLEPRGGRLAAERAAQLLPGLTSADLIATLQKVLGMLLVKALKRMVRDRLPRERLRLCMAGGCALNIKWNSMLRDSGVFEEIWIPPFPNDSGAALGTACCEMLQNSRSPELQWNVYSGPRLKGSSAAHGWDTTACTEKDVAQLMHASGEPVVILHGRAELGPRALGNRSILAPAVSPEMKDRLNDIKGRADYRPVAPICLQSAATQVFRPGGSDPFMLFEHQLQPGWATRIPAIVHLDGSARLQTIDPTTQNTVVGRILEAYAHISGIPVLCNTSANLPGSGFFPDVASALRWGRTRYVWSDGVLYSRPQGVRS